MLPVSLDVLPLWLFLHPFFECVNGWFLICYCCSPGFQPVHCPHLLNGFVHLPKRGTNLEQTQQTAIFGQVFSQGHVIAVLTELSPKSPSPRGTEAHVWICSRLVSLSLTSPLGLQHMPVKASLRRLVYSLPWYCSMCPLHTMELGLFLQQESVQLSPVLLALFGTVENTRGLIQSSHGDSTRH